MIGLRYNGEPITLAYLGIGHSLYEGPTTV